MAILITIVTVAISGSLSAGQISGYYYDLSINLKSNILEQKYIKTKSFFGYNIRQSVYKSDYLTNDNDEITSNIFSDLYNTAKNFYSDTKKIYTSPSRMTRKNAFLWSGILVVGISFYSRDQSILDALQRRTERNWYKPFADIGEKFDDVALTQKWMYYYFAGLGTGYLLKIKPLKTVSGQILESWFIGGGIKNVLTILSGRARPIEGKGPRYFKFGDGVSFYSGHTSNMFQLATILSHHVDFLPFTVACYSVATSVGLHRIHANQHWPSDVFIGAVFGITVSRAVIKLHEKRKLLILPVAAPDGKSIGFKTIYRF